MALLEPLRPIVIANQGGAALNAFGWGALEAILLDPRFHIVGASGTSSGALNVVTLAEGLIKGGPQQAIERLAEIWNELSSYQTKNIHPGIHVADAFHAMWNQMPLMAHFAAAARLFGNHHAEIANTFNGPVFNTSPLLEFLNNMEAQGRGIDFEAIQQANTITVLINATHVPVGSNPWQALPHQERLFSNRTITKEAVAASGTLPEFSPPVLINGEPLMDGVFTSNPHLEKAAMLAQMHGAALIVIRTRPAFSTPEWNGLTPRSNDEKRAFFNSMLDRQMKILAKEFPDLSVIVIEPNGLESQTTTLRPELIFKKSIIERRHSEGFAAAQAALSKPALPYQIGGGAHPAMFSPRRFTAETARL